MKRLRLPLFSVGGQDGLYMVFLPGLEPQGIRDVLFDVDLEEENLLHIYCIYESNGSEPEVDYYPIDVHEGNRDQVEAASNLIVEDYRNYEPGDLAENPEQEQMMRQLFEELHNLESLLEREQDDG